MFEISVNDSVNDVDERRDQDGDYELEQVIARANLDHHFKRHSLGNHEGDVMDDERVNELADDRASRRAEPQHAMLREVLERRENEDVDKLCGHKRHQ